MTRDFYCERIVAGRREYRCTFCREPITKGARHVHITSCACNEYFSHRAHIVCQSAADGQERDNRAWAASAPIQPPDTAAEVVGGCSWPICQCSGAENCPADRCHFIP
jgi:hypothetical protein